LHSECELVTDKLYQITEKGPRIFSKKDLIDKNYKKEPSQDYYLVYQIDDVEFNDLKNIKWGIRELQGYKTGRGSALPFSASLAEQMKAKVSSK